MVCVSICPAIRWIMVWPIAVISPLTAVALATAA